MKELSTKASILQHIYAAKHAHLSWVKKADRLVNGLDGYKGKKVDLNVDKTFIPLTSDTCEFGKWFNAHSPYLREMPSIGHFVTRIEEHHEHLHETYQYIYNIFFEMPQKRSLIHKILTFNSKKVTTQEREKAKIYLTYLKHTSKELLEVLSVLENKVKAINYNELQSVIEKHTTFTFAKDPNTDYDSNE